MATSGRSCPTCAQRWHERSARFCGACGAVLADGADREHGLERAPRRRARSAAIAAVLAVGGLATVLAMGGGPTPDEQPADPAVRLSDDDGQAVAEAELPDDEAQRLRREADPGRLRCEPRGCEAWRLDISELGIADQTASVAVVDGQVVLHLDDHLAAFDIANSELRWRAPMPRISATAFGSPWWLHPIDGGALLLRPRQVAIIDADGQLRWQTDLADELAGFHLEEGFQVDEFIVVAGWRPIVEEGDVERHVLLGFSADTGAPLWRTEGAVGARAADGIPLQVDDAGQLVRIAADTGEPRWFGPDEPVRGVTNVGPWVMAALESDAATVILDPQDGQELGRVTGTPRQSLRVDDGWLFVSHVGASADTGDTGDPPSDEPSVDLAHVRLDGTVAWVSELARGEDARSLCCPVDVTDPTTVKVLLPDEIRAYDVASGDHETVDDAAVDEDDPYQTSWWRMSESLELRAGDTQGQWHLRGLDGPHSEVVVRSHNPTQLRSVHPPVFADRDHLIGLATD